MDEEHKSFREEELDKAFFADGYKLAGELMEHNNTPAMLYKAMKQMYAGIDSLVDVFLNSAEASGTPAHCMKGCSACCHQAVYAQTHGAKYLKNWMFDHLSKEEIEGVRHRAKEKHEHTKNLSNADRLLHKEACPLLMDGACMVYEARPMACRIYLSYDKASCEYELQHSEDTSHFPSLFDFPLRSGKKMNEGFVAKLQELGMTIGELSIEEGLMN